MQFWCSARNTAWTWEWFAVPGVWVFVALVAFGLRTLNRRGAARAQRAVPPFHPVGVLGLLVLWLALDWPIGALGAGYLASAHMLQFILLALVAAPALLAAVTPDGQALIADSWLGRGLEIVTRPVTAVAVFNGIVLLTHLPTIVDGLMSNIDGSAPIRAQIGSMLIDMLWLVGGLIFWYPLVAGRPARPRFVPPLRMLYLVVGLMFSPIMFGLVGFMVYAEHPLYGLYELAPPFTGWTAKMDHELAGVMMSLSGAIVAFTGLSVIFFRWSKTDG